MTDSNAVKITEARLNALFAIVDAVGEAIKELKVVPSGHLYARLMTHNMPIDLYQEIIGILVASKKVKKKNHVLIWIG